MYILICAMMKVNGMNSAEGKEQRERYVEAWNRTMVSIWQEQITLLGVIDTGRLLGSVVSLPVGADGRFYEIRLTQRFLEYGLWQDYGTGGETRRGNGGDIGREKVRERRRWFTKKYYRSVMNLRDFMADSIGAEFCGVIADRLKDG